LIALFYKTRLDTKLVRSYSNSMKKRNHIALILIGISFLLFTFPLFGDKSELKDNRALSHYIEGLLQKTLLSDYRTALTEYILAETYDPGDPFLQVEIADCYLGIGNYAQAYVQAKEALNTGYEDEDIYRVLVIASAGLGRCGDAGRYMEKAGIPLLADVEILVLCSTISGETKAAMRTLKRLDRKHPDNPAIKAAIGELYRRDRRFKEAIEYLNESIALDTDRTQPYISLANAYLESGDFDSGMNILESYIKKFPWDSEVFEQYIEKLFVVGRLDKIKTATEQYMKRDSIRGTMYFKQYASVAYQYDYYDFALDAFLQMLEWDDTDFLSYYFAGKCYDEIWCPESSVIMYRCALDLEPSPDIYTDLALAWSRMAEPESLLATLIEAVTEFPDSGMVWYWGGVALRGIGLYDFATQWFAEALRFEPDDIGALFALADTRERSGFRSESIILMQEIIDSGNETPLVLNYLGYILVDDSTKIQYGKGLIDIALEKDPENPAYLDSYGWALFREGKSKKALRYLLRAKDRYALDTEIEFHIGDIYYELGEIQKAKHHWWRALQLDPENTKARARLVSMEE